MTRSRSIKFKLNSPNQLKYLPTTPLMKVDTIHLTSAVGCFSPHFQIHHQRHVIWIVDHSLTIYWSHHHPSHYIFNFYYYCIRYYHFTARFQHFHNFSCRQCFFFFIFIRCFSNHYNYIFWIYIIGCCLVGYLIISLELTLIFSIFRSLLQIILLFLLTFWHTVTFYSI